MPEPIVTKHAADRTAEVQRQYRHDVLDVESLRPIERTDWWAVAGMVAVAAVLLIVMLVAG